MSVATHCSNCGIHTEHDGETWKCCRCGTHNPQPFNVKPLGDTEESNRRWVEHLKKKDALRKEDFKLSEITEMPIAKIGTDECQLHIGGHTIDVVMDGRCPRDQAYLFNDKKELYVHPEDLDKVHDLVPHPEWKASPVPGAKEPLTMEQIRSGFDRALKEAYGPVIKKAANDKNAFLDWLQEEPDNRIPKEGWKKED